MGADLAKTLTRGCSVHWETSVYRVNKTVAKHKDEFDIFRHLAFQIHDIVETVDVI